MSSFWGQPLWWWWCVIAGLLLVATQIILVLFVDIKPTKRPSAPLEFTSGVPSEVQQSDSTLQIDQALHSLHNYTPSWNNETRTVEYWDQDASAGTFQSIEGAHEVVFMTFPETPEQSSKRLAFKYIRFPLWWSWDLGPHTDLWFYIEVWHKKTQKLSRQRIQNIWINHVEYQPQSREEFKPLLFAREAYGLRLPLSAVAASELWWDTTQNKQTTGATLKGGDVLLALTDIMLLFPGDVVRLEISWRDEITRNLMLLQNQPTFLSFTSGMIEEKLTAPGFSLPQPPQAPSPPASIRFYTQKTTGSKQAPMRVALFASKPQARSSRTADLIPIYQGSETLVNLWQEPLLKTLVLSKEPETYS